MAYGKNKERKDWLKRALPLGIGEVSAAKQQRFLDLRAAVLVLMRQMAQACFSQEPLAGALDGKELDAKLLAIQATHAGLNSVWREQARMRVRPALEEAHKRYLKRLAGCLRFVDQEIPKAERRPDSKRRYFHVPETVQDAVSAKELAELKAIGERGEAIELFHRVILQQDPQGLSANQVAILQDIHLRTQQKHRCPDFGAREDFTLQLHVDARMLPTGQEPEALQLLQGVPFVLADDGNRRYHRFLDLAGLAPREERLRLPLVLTRKVARRMDGARRDWASLIVEISEKGVGVRLVVGKPQEVAQAPYHHIVGRDFGYANTVSLSVARSDAAIENTDTIRADSKEAAESFFTSHALPEGVEIVERVRLEGRAFLARINVLCARIDRYRSRIDLAYNELDALKSRIVHGLQLEDGQRIEPAMKKSSAGAAVREFFQTFGRIADLKKARRALYRKIAQIKKAWFGMLSNVEVRLAQKYHALVAREDLSVQAVEKESPKYKGRTFNKMLNSGSKGQYQRRASAKLAWNGIPEVVQPSWYTSRACPRHSLIVDPKHRQGEQIFMPCCGKHEHADEHAADTIATMLLLKPKLLQAEGISGCLGL